MSVNDEKLIKKVCDFINNLTKEELEQAMKNVDRMNNLFSIAEELWGSQPEINETKVNGIYDVNCSRHGGYFVDISEHPQLKEYGKETSNANICAFEEDLEALKVLWIYPDLINNKENVDKWLNPKMIMDTYKGSEFLEEFPDRKLN